MTWIQDNRKEYGELKSMCHSFRAIAVKQLLTLWTSVATAQLDVRRGHFICNVMSIYLDIFTMNATVLHTLNSPVSEWCYINKRALPCVVQYKLSMHPGEEKKKKGNCNLFYKGISSSVMNLSC